MPGMPEWGTQVSLPSHVLPRPGVRADLQSSRDTGQGLLLEVGVSHPMALLWEPVMEAGFTRPVTRHTSQPLLPGVPVPIPVPCVLSFLSCLP